ncbi:cobalamin biosynthesis protein CobW [Streptomyces lycii]|uniref:Cobalamin biosynthesis protein CobW n=1 Tax=Streptomyces lycii TaxID=2654337 RepID=A0ABQ7FI98_9ACTN|nr:cobalamin biosynthesis protein CobW [Streptomyces lycii]
MNRLGELGPNTPDHLGGPAVDAFRPVGTDTGLAGRPRVTGLWSQAGAVTRFEPSGGRDVGSTQGQELVFIGTGLRAEKPQAALSGCLPADGEPAPDDDAFPPWGTYGIDDACEHERLGLVSAGDVRA